jgi:hypothetical protein
MSMPIAIIQSEKIRKLITEAQRSQRREDEG